MSNNTAKLFVFLLLGGLTGGTVGYQLQKTFETHSEPVYQQEVIKVKNTPDEKLERVKRFLPPDVERVTLKESGWVEFVYKGEKYIIKNSIVIPCNE